MRHELRQGDAKALLQLLCQGLNAAHGMREVAQVLLDDGQHDFTLFAAGCITNTAPRGRGNLRSINGDKAEVGGGHGWSPYERLMRKQAR
jgi:hypothetical protein